ncbi:MAG TPA: DUF58 domain-containing protein [Solirubrobacteraceae bacterium]|nr:DUF58 domain-containing protein [Solirubrobacteraceae bacterium]
MSRARALALAGAALCALAAVLAVPALYVPGLAALALATLASGWVALSSAGASVQLRAPAGTVHEGERIRLAVTVRRGLLPFPGAELVPWPGAQPLALSQPRRRRCELTVEAAAARRGRCQLGPARVRVGDPLGISQRELRSQPGELLVLPRVYPLRALPSPPPQAQPRSQPGGAFELDSLRAHPQGAPAARIHWPTVARTGTLMERSFTVEAPAQALVMLDAHLPDSEDALDRALRATASLCAHLMRRGGCLVALPGEPRAIVLDGESRAWAALHARLALVAPGGGRPPATAASRARTVLYVTASARAGPGESGNGYRVSPCPLPALPVAFTLAGCVAQPLPPSARARGAA